MNKNDNSPATNLKAIEDQDLNDREFKRAVIKKLNKLQENSKRQFNEHKNKINEQKKYFTKEIEILKKNQKKILKLKKVYEMKTALESNGNKANRIEERISNLESRNLEMIHVKENEDF